MFFLQFEIVAIKTTPDKQFPTLTKPSTTSNQQLNLSHESDEEANETIDDDEDDESMDRSIDSNNQSLNCKRNKKTRTVFSRAQVFQLESTFDMKK